MDPSHNFPPSPREMYMYRPAQQVNGHKVQSPSPSRGRPPPSVPERKPETQLGSRASRSSIGNRGSAASDVSSPPPSPGYVGHGGQYHSGNAHYQDNKPFAYVTGISPQQTVKTHNLTEANVGSRSDREASPHSRRGNVRSEGSVNSADFHSYPHDDDCTSEIHNDGGGYQRIDRSRIASIPGGGEQGYPQRGAFQPANSSRQEIEIYGQFVEPGGGSHHRPSLTYVPPPTVPSLQTDSGKGEKVGSRDQKVDKARSRDQQHHHHHPQQHKVVNNHDLASPSMQPLDTASNHNNHHHHPHCNHQHPHRHQQQHDHHPQAISSNHPAASPLASPKHAKSSMRAKPQLDDIPTPPSFPTPAHDRHAYAMMSTRTPSPPLPPPPSETGISSRSRSSKMGIEPNPPSPLAVSNSHCNNTIPQPHQHCLPGPNHHHHSHSHHHHPFVDAHPNDHPQNNHHQMKLPPAPPAPPPPPPLRTTSSSQLLINQHLDLNPPPAGVRSPRSGSPARQPASASPQHIQKQPSLATMDELAQIKLRAINDANQHSPLVSPAATGDNSQGAINVRLRPTPGKFGNIYAEDETTLPPPPPLDDLDELPPPPPPPELLCDDPPPSLSFDPASHHLHQPHLQAGEGDSTQIGHRLPDQAQWNRQPSSPTVKSQNPGSSSSSKSGISGSGTILEANSSFDQLIFESVSSMDFEIPDDVDLSQCPGLVEINKSTPNWKRDMIEKKNQEKIEEYVKNILKEREQQAKWKNVPEWKRKILQKKEGEETVVPDPTPPETKTAIVKKPAKKAPVPPPKEVKDDPLKQKGDIVPAALSIAPEELAAMPPWKRELLFKRDKVPVTFSNEFNPEDEGNAENENLPAS